MVVRVIFVPYDESAGSLDPNGQRWAGRLAAKRATLALLAVPESEAALGDVDVVPAQCELAEPCGRSHRPVAVLAGAVRERWLARGEPPITISITHAGGLAAALAACDRDDVGGVERRDPPE